MVMASTVCKKLINKTTINSFTIAISDKDSRMKSAWEQETVGMGCQLKKLYSVSPKVLHTHRGDYKEHQLISKK